MSLLYGLVSRENVVLAEYTSTNGNFPSVTRMVLTKISSQEDHKMSLAYDTQVFHYIVSSGITLPDSLSIKLLFSKYSNQVSWNLPLLISL